MRKPLSLLLLSLCALALHAQKKKRHETLHLKQADELRSGKAYGTEGISLLIGNVQLQQEGYQITSDSAKLNQTQNRAHFYRGVHLNAGDTLHLFSDAMSYDGNMEFALATGRVRLVDKDVTLTTDTLYFDGEKNQAYYRAGGKVINRKNTLTSRWATYYTQEEKVVFRSDVHILSPHYIVDSEQLTYYRPDGVVFFQGPSALFNPRDSTEIYTEKGFYNTRTGISQLTQKPLVHYRDQKLKGDSIFYDEQEKFAVATGHVEIRAPREKTLVRGEYGAYFQDEDSALIVQKPLAIKAFSKEGQAADSLYIHGDTLLIVRQKASEHHVLKAFHHVKFFKSNLQGKCDSLEYDESRGIVKMLSHPILWSGTNQMTADTILLTIKPETKALDSLKMIQNAFVVSKADPRDPNDKAFNQIKGSHLYGKFIKNELREVRISGNAESLYYADDDKKKNPHSGKPERIGINKMQCSSILMKFKDRKLKSLSCLEQPDAVLYPEKDLPEEQRVLRGFSWQQQARPHSKGAIFR